MMPSNKQTKVALVWPRFIESHVDRCIAVAQRLEGRAEVLAIEVANTSNEYSAFLPSGDTGEAHKQTLFPGSSFDDVSGWRCFWAVLRSVIGCRTICIGVPYSRLEFVVLAWVLRLLGKQVVLMCDSKFDDSLRASGFEFADQHRFASEHGLGQRCGSPRPDQPAEQRIVLGAVAIVTRVTVVEDDAVDRRRRVIVCRPVIGSV